MHMTPATINVLLNLLKQVNVNVMTENADLNYETLKTARNELLALLKPEPMTDKETASKKM